MNYDPRAPTGNRDSRSHDINLNITVPTAANTTGPMAPVGEPYSLGTAYMLCAVTVFGVAGLHRFYLGKIGTGLLYLLTFGFLGIGTLLDLFSMKSMVGEANRRDGYVAPARFKAKLPPASPKLPEKEVLRGLLLRAARENGGVLTVTQGVIASNRSFEEVELALAAMVDKGYVDVDNAPDSGVVIYKFPELEGR